MPILDLILIVFLGGFALYGFYLGFVKMVLKLLASILSIIFAINSYLTFYQIFPSIGFGSESLGKFLSFIIVLTLINFVLSFLISIIAKVLKIITGLPFISFINRVMGSLLGFAQALFILGVVIFIMSRYAISNNLLNNLIIGSDLSPILLRSVNWLEPLFPSALRILESAIN